MLEMSFMLDVLLGNSETQIGTVVALLDVLLLGDSETVSFRRIQAATLVR